VTDSKRQTLNAISVEHTGPSREANAVTKLGTRIEGAAMKGIDWGVTRMLRGAAALTALTTVGASGVSLARDAPYFGDWARGDGKTRIHVSSCGAAICARNTWVRHGVSGERVGDRLILKVKPTSAGHWSGSAFDPQRHQTYAMTVRIGADHMTTQGCVMGGFVCQSMNWTRLNRPS
jgi:uncharacterized protein (DUF2147 family)